MIPVSTNNNAPRTYYREFFILNYESYLSGNKHVNRCFIVIFKHNRLIILSRLPTFLLSSWWLTHKPQSKSKCSDFGLCSADNGNVIHFSAFCLFSFKPCEAIHGNYARNLAKILCIILRCFVTDKCRRKCKVASAEHAAISGGRENWDSETGRAETSLS